MLCSFACKYTHFSEPWYKDQEAKLKLRDIFSWHSSAKHDFVNRKFWEWCAIPAALDERGKLQLGMTGLGFAVGTEPLASHFAAKGCEILGTDLAVEATRNGWMERNEHAASLEALYFPAIVERSAFDSRVQFQPADMRTLEGLTGKYDFVWSSCALEHLGTLQAGIDFVVKSASMLKPGGVAVHTTEFNVGSNSGTIELGDNVIYRPKDLLALGDELQQAGFKLRPLNFDAGDHEYDLEYDRPPYFETDKRHIKLDIGGQICTSFLLIVERPSA